MRVRLTPVAFDDIAAIYQRAAEHSETLGDRIVAAVFKVLDLFAFFPELGVPTDEAEVHRWPLSDFRYTIFYRIRRDTIEVARIIDSSRVRDLKRVPRW